MKKIPLEDRKRPPFITEKEFLHIKGFCQRKDVDFDKAMRQIRWIQTKDLLKNVGLVMLEILLWLLLIALIIMVSHVVVALTNYLYGLIRT